MTSIHMVFEFVSKHAHILIVAEGDSRCAPPHNTTPGFRICIKLGGSAKLGADSDDR